MKSFEKFNTEAMVHHIALEEGMSYDEVLNEIAPALAAPPMWPVYAAGGAAALGLAGWAGRKLRQLTQPQTDPASQRWLNTGSFAASTDKPKPKPKVTTTGGVSATPDIKPAPPPAGKETKIGDKPVSAPSVPKPKTDWDVDPSERSWPKGMTDKPLPPKPPKPPRKPTPIRDIASVATGAAIGKATPPIGKKPAPELGADDKDKKPEPPKPAPELGADKKPKPKPVKTQAEIDREQGRNDADALPPPVRPRGTVPAPRILLPKGSRFLRSRTR